MSRPKKPMFKKGQVFFHPGQNLFVEIESVERGLPKGNLYTLRVFSHDKDKGNWKRYYEDKVVELLHPMKITNTVKVLYAK